MPYLIFDTTEDAQQRSEQEALARGLSLTRTRYWWAWQEHPSDGRAALHIPAPAVHRLTPEEQAALVETLPEGWHPESDLA